jgi:tubby-related protein 1
MVYGYVLRYRGDKAISFHFYRESDNKFLLAACMPRSAKGRVVFHNDPRIKFDAQLSDVPVHSESARFLGSVVPNFFGTAFTMHDYRVDNPLSTRKRVHHELGFVAYQVNMFGRVPNTLEATLPRWDPEQGLQGQTYSLSARYAKQTQTRLQQGLGLLQRIKANKADEYQAVELDDQEDLLTFETKKPEWNEELQAWTLNFNGRVKMASKKNFLLVPNPKNEAMDEEFGSQTICLRFGKVLKDRFSLDYRHPISPFQAFAIALTSFSSKLVVT